MIPNGVYNETEAYDTLSNMWIKLAATAHPRHLTNAAVIGRCTFIPEGGIETAVAAVSTNDAFCIQEESMGFMERAARSKANIQVKPLKKDPFRQSYKSSWLSRRTLVHKLLVNSTLRDDKDHQKYISWLKNTYIVKLSGTR